MHTVSDVSCMVAYMFMCPGSMLSSTPWTNLRVLRMECWSKCPDLLESLHDMVSNGGETDGLVGLQATPVRVVYRMGMYNHATCIDW
jgi:hypothetical protein